MTSKKMMADVRQSHAAYKSALQRKKDKQCDAEKLMICVTTVTKALIGGSRNCEVVEFSNSSPPHPFPL